MNNGDDRLEENEIVTGTNEESTNEELLDTNNQDFVGDSDGIKMNSTKLVNDNEESADLYAYAGFWMRFWAYLVDLIVIAGLRQLIVSPILGFLDQESADGIFSLPNILSAVVFYLYFVLLTKYFGQTLGKMIFGIKVIPLKEKRLSWQTVLFREWIGRYISASIFILYALVAFLPKKQGLHDYFADTTVIHENYVRKNITRKNAAVS